MDKPRLELTGSRLFAAWLASARASLAFATHQAGKLFLIGTRPVGFRTDEIRFLVRPSASAPQRAREASTGRNGRSR